MYITFRFLPLVYRVLFSEKNTLVISHLICYSVANFYYEWQKNTFPPSVYLHNSLLFVPFCLSTHVFSCPTLYYIEGRISSSSSSYCRFYILLNSSVVPRNIKTHILEISSRPRYTATRPQVAIYLSIS